MKRISGQKQIWLFEEQTLKNAVLEIDYHAIRTLEHMLPNGKNWYI